MAVERAEAAAPAANICLGGRKKKTRTNDGCKKRWADQMTSKRQGFPEMEGKVNVEIYFKIEVPSKKEKTQF
jgi:hypothetical protein